MNVRKMGARLAALALFSTGLVGVGAVTGAGPAMACGEDGGASHHFARSLPQVRPGQSGTYVLATQLELRRKGYKLNGTGYYGSHTLAAVKDFQRKHQIKASGIVGPKTWDAMIGDLPPDLTGPGMMKYRPKFVVRPGDRTELHLRYLNEVLERTTTNYSALEKAWDGKSYNPAVQKLVRDFQRKNGIKASGIVGPKTWTAFYRVISATGEWGC
jgi:peptidoglycan hydrolase-like protein with peptidoglycan-binding domain